MVPPIHLGAWSMALMLWLPFELLLVETENSNTYCVRTCISTLLSYYISFISFVISLDHVHAAYPLALAAYSFVHEWLILLQYLSV